MFRVSCFFVWDKMRKVLLVTVKGVILSVCNVCWEDFLMGALIEWVMDDLIILVVAFVSRVSCSE